MNIDRVGDFQQSDGTLQHLKPLNCIAIQINRNSCLSQYVFLHF